MSIVRGVSCDTPQSRRRKGCVHRKMLACVCLKFRSAQLELLLEVGVGSQEGILEFDRVLPAKLSIFSWKQFILETLYHVLAFSFVLFFCFLFF